MMMQIGDAGEVDGEGPMNSGSSRQTAGDEKMILVGFKRTLHTAHQMRPSKKHSHRYPHHHKHRAARTRHHTVTTGITRLLWSFLVLFLVICDSQTESVWRALFVGGSGGNGAEAASILPAEETVATVSPGAVGLLGAREGDSITEEAASGGASVNHTKLLELVMEGLGLTTIPDVRLRIMMFDIRLERYH
uniref:Uncharacterized protein n=1 Tax=Anopheles albimanus TaxID=7167 RepID=A0A182FTY9_ANOAL